MQHPHFERRPTQPTRAAATAGRRVATIILADDSILQRMMTRALLEREGYHVLEAGTGAEVLDLMGLARPDLILMDVAMPSMDGMAAARRIRDGAGRAASVPIVFVTALGASADRARAFEAGGNAYLVKPIAERELLRVVKGHIRGR